MKAILLLSILVILQTKVKCEINQLLIMGKELISLLMDDQLIFLRIIC